MAVQKDHDLADDFLIGPGRGDLVGALRADAFDLSQSLGPASMMSKTSLPKSLTMRLA